MLDHEQWLTLHHEANRLDAPTAAILIDTARALYLLGPNSRALVHDVVRRLVVGMPLGDWNRPIDLVANAVEESVDKVDYLIQERRKQAQRLAAIDFAIEKALESDVALRNIPADDCFSETERPPAKPLAAGG